MIELLAKSTSRKISYYNNRPKLFSSFRFSTTTSDDVDNNEKIEEKEYDCIIEYNESKKRTCQLVSSKLYTAK